MTKRRRKKQRPIETYEHRDKQRTNNPPVGLVTPDTGQATTYAYDPHLSPRPMGRP